MVVIDACFTNGKVADIAFSEACQVARLITPVPGGVGPITIAMLVEQTVRAAEAVHPLVEKRSRSQRR
jgi:methylenetetrahydrofolate dehydrogenase (NADP+)/methenyltetrahydrofolate cyclohydrolase